MKSSAVLKSAMRFEVEVDGHRFYIDADEKAGGTGGGPRPKPLLLSALAGCTAMDVIAILRKMKHEPESFQVEAEGRVTDDHPKIFKSLHLRYIFKGPNLDQAKIQKAVNLSLEKYCGVSAMLKKAAAFSHEIIIE